MSGAQPPAELELTEEERRTLERLVALLARDRHAPSSVRDPERAWRVHIADSLCAREVDGLPDARRIADLGSGAGFPGMALAVVLPAAQVDLIESVGRKCEFMRRALREAEIPNARVIPERSEVWAAAEGREAYDAVTARAVGRLATVAELASPMLRRGGLLVVWKGRRDADEEAELERACIELAMRPLRVIEVGPFAGSRHRHLHVAEKVAPTPPNLPRRAGVAKKRPLGAARPDD